jgi:hypothetical protein
MHTTRSDFRILIARLLADSMLAAREREDLRRVLLAALSNNIFIPPATRQGNGSHQL